MDTDISIVYHCLSMRAVQCVQPGTCYLWRWTGHDHTRKIWTREWTWVWERERKSVKERNKEWERERERERKSERESENERERERMNVLQYGDVKPLSHKSSWVRCHMTSHSMPLEDSDLYVSQHSPPPLQDLHYQAVGHTSTYRVKNSQISWLIPVPTGLKTVRFHG